MSLDAYRAPRRLGVDGIFLRSIVAVDGIKAGSGFATTELRMLLMDFLEATFDAHGPSVRLTLYVDDLTISVRGTAKFVTKKLADAVDLVVQVFQDQLALKVSVAKSTVVASTRKLAAKVARKAKSNVLGT